MDAGGSWTVCDGAVWELVTYLPGEVVGWRSRPSLAEVGHLLARYHDAAATITPVGQRPRAFALDRIVALPSHGVLQCWLGELADDLARIGHREAEGWSFMATSPRTMRSRPGSRHAQTARSTLPWHTSRPLWYGA